MPNHIRNIKTFFGRPYWRNNIKTLRVEPMKYYKPDNLSQIIDIVQEAIDSNVSVRAVGSGHSFSHAPKAEGILVDTDLLDKVEIYPGAKNLLEVEGGIKLFKLNKIMDQMGLCIPTMGGIDHQSVAGAISTGTHGSSLRLGGMSKIVRSIVLVTHDLANPSQAKAYRIEPESRKLTDPDQYEGPELIQDDDIFNTALVCFGMMGVIYSYVLEVEKMYYLKEVRAVSNWKTVRAKLLSGELFDSHHSVMVQVNPYKIKSEHQALVISHDKYPNAQPTLELQFVKHKIGDKIRRVTRSPLYTLASILKPMVYFIMWRINRKPKIVPKLINQAIDAQRDEEYFHKGHKVMYQGQDFIKERAYDCELAIELDGEGIYLNFLDQLMQYLENLHEKYSIHVTSPLGLRFIKKSEVFLTPEEGFDVCYIDTPVLKHIYGREVLLSKIQQFTLACKDFNNPARLHWGKLNSWIDQKYVSKAYPRFDDFMSVMKRFNPQQLFSNSFTRRVVDY